MTPAEARDFHSRAFAFLLTHCLSSIFFDCGFANALACARDRTSITDSAEAKRVRRPGSENKGTGNRPVA